MNLIIIHHFHQQLEDIQGNIKNQIHVVQAAAPIETTQIFMLAFSI